MPVSMIGYRFFRHLEVSVGMFGQLLFVRLRAAEKALRDGRLDEAFRLASATDLRNHPRGKVVLTTLSERLLARARENYRADKFTEALMDLDRAEAGGVLKPEIDELRGYVRLVAAEHDRRNLSRQERLHEAQKRIERGSVAAGKEVLNQAAAEDPAVRAMIQRAEGRAQDAQRAMSQAERAFKAGQFAQAANRLARARRLDAHCEGLAYLQAELIQTVLGNVNAAIQNGNLGRAAGEWAALRELGPGPREDVTEILETARDAGDCFRRHDYREARRHALVLARKLPKAAWVQAVNEQLDSIESLHAACSAGPIGERIELPGERRANGAAGAVPAGADGYRKEPRSLDETIALGPTGTPAVAVAERYLLLVDGGGSYLLIRGGQASIGRAASEIPADVPILSDLAERHANITRIDDDYFIVSSKDVEVSGRPTQHALLKDGDRVVLGRKAKFTFRSPSRKSSTAVLELSDTTKAPNDVRRVVLLNNHALVSNSPTAHVFCRHAGCSLILFERGGSLWIRAKSDGHIDTEARPLVLGETVEIAGASLVLAPWKVPGAKGAA